jgi:hypothetical protein
LRQGDAENQREHKNDVGTISLKRESHIYSTPLKNSAADSGAMFCFICTQIFFRMIQKHSADYIQAEIFFSA